MKHFLKVLGFELGNYYKNRSFVLTTALLAIIAAGVIAVPALIPGFLGGSEKGSDSSSDKMTLGICYDNREAESFQAIPDNALDASWKAYDSRESLKKAVETEDIEGGFIVNSGTDYTYVVQNNSMYDRMKSQFDELMKSAYELDYLVERGVSPEDAMALQQVEITSQTEILGKDSARNYGYTYILIFVLYFLILFYGQMIATAVTTEKSNRAIEILVTSVNSNSLIFGKVIAGAIAGILQVAIIMGAAFGTYGIFRENWGYMLDFLFHVPGQVWATYAVFGILGYLLYAFIYGMLGALVSKTEDISKSSTFITLIYIASFFIAIWGLQDSDGTMIRVASFIPFTSSNSMLIRVSMGSVALWEIGVSLVLLAGSCLVVGILAAKLFRMGTLMYGNPVKFTTALKKLRQ